MNAPIKIAVAPSPGTPSVSMGIIVAPQAPLLADSEAATPSISPWPKSLGMAGGLLHLVIRDERRQTTASSRGCADNDADQGANADWFAASPILVLRDFISGDG